MLQRRAKHHTGTHFLQISVSPDKTDDKNNNSELTVSSTWYKQEYRSLLKQQRCFVLHNTLLKEQFQ
jgi:hypothetical protein